MNMTGTDEDRQQWALLTDPSTATGAGMMRYAAAMHLYRRGYLGAQSLETYRALSKQDGNLHPEYAAHVIRCLVAGIAEYLDRRFHGRFVEVRDGIARIQQSDIVVLPAREVEACRHVDAALAACADPLSQAIGRAAPLLQWGTYDLYPIEAIGEAFAKGHAFASVAGEAAPIYARNFDLGLFVIAPNILYRDRKHRAPELYVPLTGPHRWRFDPGSGFAEKPAHEPVWNEPNAPHATVTGSTPFLALYCWTSDVNEPAVVIPAGDWELYEVASRGR